MRDMQRIVVFGRVEQRFVGIDLLLEFFGDRFEWVESLLLSRIILIGRRGGGRR